MITVVLVLLALAGCAVNPVTGKRELSLVSEGQEIALGEENYAYMQQSGGGEYDVDPLLTEYIQGIGNRLAEVSDRPLPYEFVVLNSSVPNAWALPGGKIAINRGLLTEMNSEAELAAVLGHEIVHAAARHSARQMSRGMLLQVAVVGTAIATSGTGYSDLAMGGASVGAQLINQSYGRSAELESDFYGMQYMSRAGYDPQGAVELQRTFVRLSEGRESDWLTGLFASHPPSQERVDTNIQTATTLPAGGEIGADKFKAAMQMTLDIKPAYDLLDEGRESLGEKSYQQAVSKAEEAIALFPDEANFYALRGDARYLSEEYEMAISNYDIAIRRRENFFQYHLQRGLANEKLGNNSAALTDLERSNELFPTAIATYSLGNIESARGNRDKAIEYYTAVANSSGDIAVAARDKMVRLEFEERPDKYLRVGCYADNRANLVVAIANTTSVRIADIRFVVQVRDAYGGTRNVEDIVRGPIGAGQRGDRNTGIGPYDESIGCPVRVTSARINE
ncbi:MAG: M48 family metalloprotease [Woeseiaceae bacterium]